MNNVDPVELDKFAKLAEQWWDREGDLKTLHDINPTRLEFIQKIIPINGLNILDVGCGGGILANALALHGGNVVGIDLEKNAIEAACFHVKDKKLALRFQCISVREFEQQGFDVVTCMELLEHVPDPQALIADSCAKLNKGGILFLSTINRTLKAYTHAILGAEYLLKLLPKQTHDYKKFLKPSEIATILRNNGFELIKLSGMTYNPFTRQANLAADVSVNYLIAARKL
jgi:2-polyprenyl-6-hydroxyphenyl methylase / 3-demethylubiquinone-9 3-methyltransferase